jgi:hypothetical protein
MFDSLDEQMKKDESHAVSPKERVMRWFLYVGAAAVVFGGLIFSARFLAW